MLYGVGVRVPPWAPTLMKISFGLTDQHQPDLHSELALVDEKVEYWNYNLKRQELNREKILVEYELYDLPCVRSVLPIMHKLILKPHLKMCGLSHSANTWLPNFYDTILRVDYTPLTEIEDELPLIQSQDLENLCHDTQPGKLYMPLYPIYTNKYQLTNNNNTVNHWYHASDWSEDTPPHYYEDRIRPEFYLDLRFPLRPDKYTTSNKTDWPTEITRFEQQFLDLGFSLDRVYHEASRKIEIGKCVNYNHVAKTISNNRYVTRASWSIE